MRMQTWSRSHRNVVWLYVFAVAALLSWFPAPSAAQQAPEQAPDDAQQAPHAVPEPAQPGPPAPESQQGPEQQAEPGPEQQEPEQQEPEQEPEQEPPSPAVDDQESRQQLMLLRAQVQRALSRFTAQVGQSVASPLLERYHQIPYHAALADPSLREGVSDLFRQLLRDIESPPATAMSSAEYDSQSGANSPGRPYKTAGVAFLLVGGVSVIAGIYATKYAYEEDPTAGNSTNAHVYLLSGGFGAMVVGALLYNKGMNADRQAATPGYAAPLVTSDELGVVFGGTF